MIADLLHKKLKKVCHRCPVQLEPCCWQELTERESYFSKDLGHQRPVLVLLDRQVDLPVMIHHGWSYQALVHETSATRLNHVTCQVARWHECCLG